jgi:hypothetical protein
MNFLQIRQESIERRRKLQRKEENKNKKQLEEIP